MKRTTRWVLTGLLLVCVAASVLAQKHGTNDDSREAESDQVKRINAAAKVLDEIMNVPDKGIPEGLLASSKCIAVVPSLIKGGFIVGGHYGKGVATCRTSSGWSAPAPFLIEGGSWGLQFGGETVDLVMLVTNDKGMRDFLTTKFKLGAGASITAGPVGRDTAVGANPGVQSEIISYSRSRGVFAGIDLNGAVIKQDADATRDLYGRVVPLKAVLLGKVSPPEGCRHFLTVVRKWATPNVQASQAAPEAVADSSLRSAK
jgi:lipid-binding SYLF domain-containing protein